LRERKAVPRKGDSKGEEEKTDPRPWTEHVSKQTFSTVSVKYGNSILIKQEC
jgi:hypothetical protein